MNTTMTQEILREEEQLADAKRTLDLDALNRIYADELLMNGGASVQIPATSCPDAGRLVRDPPPAATCAPSSLTRRDQGREKQPVDRCHGRTARLPQNVEFVPQHDDF
jgi:hypothetical protein